MKYANGTHGILLALIFVSTTMMVDGAAAVDGSRITGNKQYQLSSNRPAIGRRRKRRDPLSPNSLHLLLVRGGAVNAAIAESETASSNQHLKTKTLNTLHQTSFLMVASVSMVMFSPLPSLTRCIAESNSITSSLTPQARAVQILAFLTAISAAIELFLSPLIGVLIDSFGRKVPSVILHGFIAIANLAVVCKPGVWSVCASRMVNVVTGGFLVIVSNSVIADTCFSSSNSNEMMGSVLGRQAACVSLGFLFGSVAGGRLTEYGERYAYGAALVFSLLAALNVAFRMLDSLEFTRDANTVVSTARTSAVPADENANEESVVTTLRNKFVEAPISSIQLLFHYGSHMRTLAILMLLQSAPIYMGDVFQMFAKEEWNLLPKDFANMVAMFGILGIVSNISLPLVLQSLGSMRNFSLFAIASSLLFPLVTICTNSYKCVLVAGCVGLYASAQKVGTSAAMTSLATEMGIPQGQLQGEKASMLALLKIGSPIVYGMLYLKGKDWSSSYAMGGDGAGGAGGDAAIVGLEMIMGKIGRKLPFVLNVILGICAFAVTWQNL